MLYDNGLFNMEVLWPGRIETSKWLIAANCNWLGMIYPTFGCHRMRELILNAPLGGNLGAWPENGQEYHVTEASDVFSDIFSKGLRFSSDLVPRPNLGLCTRK